ncbi:MAG: hypothetical protein MUC29_12905, partial [Pyrinomonadaceae bacterium]|nr:hypothetical protein [Pyrinomonadaceae bacterium]
GILTFGAVAYTFLAYFLSKKNTKKTVTKEFEEAFEIPKRSVFIDVILIIFGLVLLVIGANLLVNGAITIAKLFGLSEVIIGLTIVAVGTSLPELATSAIAAKKGEADVALGNVIGSNVLNILAILGVTALIQPISLEGVRTLDLGIMLGSAVLLNILLGSKLMLDRIEGTILIIGYFIYIYTLIP